MKWNDGEEGASACTAPDASRLVAALEAYQDALRAGDPVDRADFLARHAEVADELAGYLDALDLIQSAGGEETPGWGADEGSLPLSPGDCLAEYRIVRELGRGGMGVVYEAEQRTIPERRVALKVLTANAALDPRALQRFRLETQAAA